MAADLTYRHAMWLALRVFRHRHLDRFSWKGTPFLGLPEPLHTVRHVGTDRASRPQDGRQPSSKSDVGSFASMIGAAVVLAWDKRCVLSLLDRFRRVYLSYKLINTQNRLLLLDSFGTYSN